MKKQTTRGVIYALTAGICWGLSGTIGQFLFTYKNIDTGWLTSVRMIISGLLLVIFAAIKSPSQLKGLWASKRTAVHTLIFAVFGLMAVQFSYMHAISFSNSGTATAIQYLGEAFILLYTCITVKRLPTWIELCALILALFGIFLIASHGRLDSLAVSPKGLVWGIIAAISLMTYTVIPVDLIKRFGSIPVTGCGMLIGGIVLTLAMRTWRVSVSFDWEIILALAAIIIIGTVAAFSMFLQSAADIGSVKAGLLASVETMAAAFFAAAWLKTKFAAADYAGFICITAMVVLLASSSLGKNKS